MPYGMIFTSIMVAVGGSLGFALRRHISQEVREKLPMLCGITAICSGILSVIRVDMIPIVTLAVILGGWLGIILKLEKRARAGMSFVLKKFSLPDSFDMDEYVTVMSVLCCSGFGIYGVMLESFAGEHTQIMTKAILDGIVSLIYGSTLGACVSLIAIPQFIIFVIVFFLAKLLMPVMSDAMLQNFIACGGVLTMAAGLRMARIKSFPLIDMLPSLAFVLIFTWIYFLLAG